MSDYNDYPLMQIAESMERQARRGATCYQKYTCVGCGDRVTVAVPNVVFGQVQHEECGVITDLREVGCNFMFILSIGRN